MREVPRQKPKFMDRIGQGIDRIVGIWNPKEMFRRRAYRQAVQIQAASSSGYRGASTSRLRSDWAINDASADQEIIPDLSALRARSRDLNRNNAFAAGITSTITSNDIGTGIRPQSRPDNTQIKMAESKLKNFTTHAERAFGLWVPEASADERMDFYDLQHLCDRSILESGEFIAIPVMVDEPYRHFKFAWQAVEADRLMTPSDLLTDKTIRGGVKIGERGQPIGYYIRKNHPGDGSMTRGQYTNNSKNFIYYPARNMQTGRPNIMHLFMPQRSGQSRGVPFFAPVLNYFKDMADYLEAKLVSARVAACFSIFVKRQDVTGAVTGNTDSYNSKNQRLTEVEPGMVEHLADGESIETATPPQDGSFEPFTTIMLRSISSALGLPYELVAKDFSKSNFANARAALLEARRYFQWRQSWIARKFCQPSWDMVMEEAYLTNMLPSVNFFDYKRDLCRVRWITPGWQWISPKEEATAAQIQIDNGLGTLADIAAERGKDWEEQLEQTAKERKKIKDLEEQHDIVMFPSQKNDSGNNPEPVNAPAPDGGDDSQEEE